MDSLVSQILENFKAAYGLRITDSSDLFLTEKNLLEFLMKLGRATMGAISGQLDSGYAGAVIRKDGRKYKFVDYRSTSLHGLFGMIDYRRAYYFSKQEGGGGYFPQDEKLGIQKRHTPGCQYYLSTFTGREAYQKSLDRFHEIFRPDAMELISLRAPLITHGVIFAFAKSPQIGPFPMAATTVDGVFRGALEEVLGHGRRVGRASGGTPTRGDRASLREEAAHKERECDQGPDGGIGGCDQTSSARRGTAKC